MYFIAKVSFFLRRTFAIISTISTERVAIACPSKLTDSKRIAIYYNILADRERKNGHQFLPEQFRCLEKSPSGTMETATAAKIWEKMSIISFYKTKPGILRIKEISFHDKFSMIAEVRILLCPNTVYPNGEHFR